MTLINNILKSPQAKCSSSLACGKDVGNALSGCVKDSERLWEGTRGAAGEKILWEGLLEGLWEDRKSDKK